MVFIWYLYGIYMVFIWYLYGIYIVFIWYLYGIYMVFIWYLYGIYIVSISYLYRIKFTFPIQTHLYPANDVVLPPVSPESLKQLLNLIFDRSLGT